MNDIMKQCVKCGKVKPLDEFNDRKDSKDGKRGDCKECTIKYSIKWREEHQEEIKEGKKKWYEEHRKEINNDKKKYYKEHQKEFKEYSDKNREKLNKRSMKYRYKKGSQSMYENKNCTSYLGVVVGERLCKHLFNDVKMMPYGNSGYDLICNKGKKIDVKTSCMYLMKSNRSYWRFVINKNTIADYFICVAFDNRTDLNPLHMWMIPGDEVSDKVSISINSSTIHNWDKWKRDINDAQLCCNTMKK